VNHTYNVHLFAADCILFIHFAFVIFIVFGILLIWIGYFAGWNVVRNAKFRVCHIFAMGFVLFESVISMICPLTLWENRLRIKGEGEWQYDATFMHEWIHTLLYYDFSAQTFTIIYTMVFFFILFAFWIIPPEFKKQKQKLRNNSS